MPVLGIIASQISGHLFTQSAFDSIATTTLSTSTASVTFSSIPATYTHLQIRGIVKTNAGSDTQNYMRFNGDTGSNYSTHYLYGYGEDPVGAGAGASTSFMSAAAVTSDGANVFSAFVMDVVDYADTNKYKTLRALSGNDTNGAGYVWFSSGNWRNTAAVTSITIYNNGSNNFLQYSSFALYGIKAA